MNPEKVLPIEDKVSLEKKGLKIEHLSDSRKITTENDFEEAYQKGLNQKNVGLYDANISIIKDGNQFLIGKKDNTKFTEYINIANTDLLKKFVQYTTNKYYRSLFTSVDNNFNVDVSTTSETNDVNSTQEVMKIIVKEQEALNNLKEDITLDNIIASTNAIIGPVPAGGLVYRENGQQRTINKSEYDILDKEIKDKLNLSKKDDIIYRKNLNIFKNFLDEQKEAVRSIQVDANKQKNNKDLVQNRKEKLQNRKNSLDYIHAQLKQYDLNINDRELMNKPFDAKTYNIDMPIYSSVDIKKLQKLIGTQDIEQNAIDEGMFNTALLKLDVDDRKEFQTYLNEVIVGKKRPETDKYKPKNEEAFRDLCQTFPFLQGYIDFSDKINKNSYKPDVQNNLTDNADNDPNDPVFQKQIKENPHYGDRKDALAKGGLTGLMSFGIDQTNMKPEQKQFRGGVGQLAITAGAVFIGWKMLKSAFNLITGAHKGEDDKNKLARRKDRAWLLGPAAIVFGLQATTGEGAGGILNGGKGTEWLAGLFGGSKDKTPDQNKKTEKFQEKYGEGVEGSISIFKDMSYGNIQKLVEKKDGKMKLKGDAYDAFMEKFKGERNPDEKNPAGIKFLESIGKTDDNNMIDLGFNAMGITRETLQDTNKADTKINDTYAKVAVKLGTITAFMEEKGYNRIDPDKMDKIEAYLQDADATADDLDDLADEEVFVKGDIKDETGLNFGEKIKKLANGNQAKEEALLIGMNKFYEYMPTADKDIELIGDGHILKMKTYDKETTIDINKKSLVDFSPSGFKSYFELFKAASLTNRIKKMCEDKTAVSEKPFTVSKPGGDIEFNDAKVFSTKFDTEILSAGPRGALKTISPTLEKYKQEYCDYLNNTTPKFWKEAPAA